MSDQPADPYRCDRLSLQVRIVPTWAPTVYPLYVGLRTREGGDMGLDAGFVGRLTVHSANITGPQDAKKTLLLTTLKREWHAAAAPSSAERGQQGERVQGV